MAPDMGARRAQATAELAVSKGKQKSDPAGERPAEPVVRAAGGLLRRSNRRGVRRRSELAVVHRPRYDDWSFPKGKRESDDEDDAATALREVREETGFHCRLGRPIGSTRYRDARGRDKVVRYWLMTLDDAETGDDFVVNREVDELRWCTPKEASRLLTYDHDRALLRGLGR
jgi:8-oxo-dGTP pyrophosphatase MutT (NUDIX family)